jgi:hypothetical protein
VSTCLRWHLLYVEAVGENSEKSALKSMHATKALWRVRFQNFKLCTLQRRYGGYFSRKKNILHLLPRLTKILASDRSSPCTRQRHYGWYFSRTLVHARYKGGMEDTFFFSQKLCLAISLLFLRYRFQALLLFLHTYVYCTYECGAYEYAYGCPAYVCILYIWVWCV